MAVRVKIRIELNDKRIETPALVNSGFETDVPTLVIPLKIAEMLGIDVKELREETYLGAGGTLVPVRSFSKETKVSVVCDDRIEGPVKSNVDISPGEKEVVLSDAATSKLKISLEDVKDGKWRFREEQKIRESVEKKEWI